MKDTKKRSKLWMSVASLVLAASLLIGGGTLAYLRAESEPVVNDFKANQVDVSLTETDNDYSIIPGTSQDKDPTVHVNTTVPAYVYVTVEDKTQGLVDYTIAEGWLPLEDHDGNVVEGVYYREVEASDEEQLFPVLEGNKVYYDAALENSDMLNEDGTLKDGLTLTFTAGAVQKAPFEDPYKGYIAKDYLIMNEDELVQAIEEEWKYKIIGQDFTVVSYNIAASIPDTELVDIDLNGFTLTFKTSQEFGLDKENPVEQHVRFKDGGMNILMPAGSGGRLPTAFQIDSTSSLTLENVEVQSLAHTTFYVVGNQATLNVTNCHMETTPGNTYQNFLISTNSSNTPPHYGVVINVKDSYLKAAFSDGWTVTPIMLNVPGNLTIENSTLIGERHALAVRGGTAVVKDSVLLRPYAYEDEATYEDYYLTHWGDSTNIPFAALFVGNKVDSTSYQYPAEVTLVNTEMTSCDMTAGGQRRAVYLCGNQYEGNAASLTFDENCTFNGRFVVANEYTVVNGATGVVGDYASENGQIVGYPAN